MLPNKPFIIAEVGINHNGSIELARDLIRMSKECGADAVKFQKRDVMTVYSEEERAKPRKSPWGTTNGEQKFGLELTEKSYDEIDSYCKELGIPWFASAWDCKSQKFIQKYNCMYNKIASAMLTHRDYVNMVASEGKYTFISTGMSKVEEIDRVVDLFEQKKTPYCLMHCVSKYPCPDNQCNLLKVRSLWVRYSCDVGYSGHEEGITPSVLACSLGAVAVERHVTLDRSMYGSDQSASLEREGLYRLVRDCRGVKDMLGTGEIMIMPDEEEVKYKLRYFKEW
jgi:N-acetylneuraminate synthase